MKKRMSNILLLLAMLILSSYAVAAQCLDQDGDLYGVGCELGGDCNDNDLSINPGMSEFCGNGVDDNCDGVVDEGSCCADFDSDSYGNPGSEICAEPATDCDNTNPSINPGVSENTFELCLDGVDNNCNGLIDKDDTGCSAFYPPGEEELTSESSSTVTSSGVSNLAEGGSFLCTISKTAWTDMEGNILTEIPPGEDIALMAFGQDCEDEEVTFEIHKQGGNGLVESGKETFSAYTEGEAATYVTQAPTEEGIYAFTATTEAETLTSTTLVVGAVSDQQCEIQWDCSSIDYGECVDGIKTRSICTGYEGTAQCCSDEASCLCAPIMPTGICTEYTYALAESQKSCITQETPKFKETSKKEREEETPEEGAKLPWGLIGAGAGLLVLIIGVVLFFMLKKPVAQVPASLINYIKSAKDKKISENAIKQALEKSGWKPEQIKAAFKKAK